ncbi:MAG: MFS transporter, partial [Alphaproteobacteria bacterium]
MNEAPGLTRGERRRGLAAIITTIAVYGVTLGLISPLISLILESRTVERAIIGMNAAVPALAVLLVSPLVPRMIRALGYRRVIMLALVVEVAVLLLFPALDDLAVWFVLRFVLGASGALLFIAAESWINQLAEDTTRGRVVSIYVMAISAGLALGP